jgi:hypothetical protein
MRNGCGDKPSAAAHSACPMPLRFIASTCMLQNARSAIGPLSVRTLQRLRRGFLGRFGDRFVGRRSRSFRRIFCADPPRSPDGAPTANLPSKDRVSGSGVPRPARFDTRPRRGSTRTDCRRLPRNDKAPSEILQCSRRTREPEMSENKYIRNMCRIRTVTDARLGRQDKAVSPLPELRS